MNRRDASREVHEFPLADATMDPSRLPTYRYDSYRGVGLNDLLAFAVSCLEEWKHATTFENVAVAAHCMFPGKFSLVGYPQFPDAARVQLVILHLGPKYVGWLEGKKRTGYYLNTRGREAARRAAENLGTPQSGNTAPKFVQDNLANRTAVETRVARLRDSDSFRQFMAGNGQAINDVTLAWEVYGLFITADSLTKAETHRQLVEAARRQDDQDVEHFLSWVAKERPYLVGRAAGSKEAQARRRKSRGRSRK